MTVQQSGGRRENKDVGRSRLTDAAMVRHDLHSQAPLHCRASIQRGQPRKWHEYSRPSQTIKCVAHTHTDIKDNESVPTPPTLTLSLSPQIFVLLIHFHLWSVHCATIKRVLTHDSKMHTHVSLHIHCKPPNMFIVAVERKQRKKQLLKER